MQQTLRSGKVARSELWPGEQAAIQSAVDQFLFFFARRFQYVVGDLVALTRMPDADTQTPEVRHGKVRLNIFQSVVPAIAASLFDANVAR